ncbi:MAG: acetyl-CoA carboxylase biotin carboxylase subunit [Thermomicrobiales bacterium]|nr:acetyl-CoA carboxylase biotin carboxylase subunit [Thermomicrobiales bacterium]
MTERTVGSTRVLIANRGEIALRVIRACRELGLDTVAVYGPGEESARHVLAADDAYRIPESATLPYLDIPAILDIAARCGASIIHPGYGFLSENAAFADGVVGTGLTFAGPSAAAMRALGDKIAARNVAIRAGVPVVPGTADPVASVDEARAWADVNGYPVAVKAAGGGGGRGFRVALGPDLLEDAFLGSSGEAKRYFANPDVFLERYVANPRHIEVQIIADGHGNVVALGERDCSVQRRHQKLIEETPSPIVTPELRARLLDSAVKLANEVGYVSAGTIEYLVNDAGEYFFLEMNTRIQVEHTITEMVTGIDLVKEQLRIAQGEALSFTQADIDPRGHAIQCRINAEDAGRDFAPTPGVLTGYREPGGIGVRVDSAMETGAAILPAYDSMIAKLVTWGRDRDEALDRMSRALGEFVIEGVATTIPFHARVMDHPVFRAGQATTAFVPEHPEVIPEPQVVTPAEPSDDQAPVETVIEVNGRRLKVSIHGGIALGAPVAATNGNRPTKRGGAGKKKAGGGDLLESPIQGTVIRLNVAEGQQVAAGELICVVEAMKMENEITAHKAGSITALHIAQGASVQIGGAIADIKD